MTKLLVASGVGTVASVEVINLDKSKPDLVCDNLPDLPSKTAFFEALKEVFTYF